MRGEIAWSQNDVQALLVNTCTRSRLGFGTFGAIKPSVKMFRGLSCTWSRKVKRGTKAGLHLRTSAHEELDVVSKGRRSENDPPNAPSKPSHRRKTFPLFFILGLKRKTSIAIYPPCFQSQRETLKKKKKKEHGSFKICMKAKLTKFKE